MELAYGSIPSSFLIKLSTDSEGEAGTFECEYGALVARVDSLLASLSSEEESEAAKGQAIRELWDLSCRKSPPLPGVRDFHPAALLGHRGACRVLVRLLEECTTAFRVEDGVCLLALHLTWNLSAYVENKVMLVQEGVVQCLVRLLDIAEVSVPRGLPRGARSFDRCISAVLQNVAERRFRKGETNPMQLRIAAEGGLGALARLASRPLPEPVARLVGEAEGMLADGDERQAVTFGITSHAQAASEDMSVQLVSLLGCCNLSLHPGNEVAFESCGVLGLLDAVVSSRVVLDHVATGDALDSWLSLMPMVPLLASQYGPVRAFALQLLTRCACVPRYIDRLWKDLALVEGSIAHLRHAADSPDSWVSVRARQQQPLTAEVGESSLEGQVAAIVSTALQSLLPTAPPGPSTLDVAGAMATAAAATPSHVWTRVSEDGDPSLILRRLRFHRLSLGEALPLLSGPAPEPVTVPVVHPWDEACSSDAARFILLTLNATSAFKGIPALRDSLAGDLGQVLGVHVGGAAPRSSHSSQGSLQAGASGSTTFHTTVPPGLFSDVTFVVGEEACEGHAVPFSAHRIILACRVPTMAALFTFPGQGQARTDGTATVRLPDVHPDGFRCLLEWAYTGRLGGIWTTDDSTLLRPDIVLHGLEVADRFDLPDLRLLVEEAAAQAVDDSNAQDVLQLAQHHRAEHLARHCEGVLEAARRSARHRLAQQARLEKAVRAHGEALEHSREVGRFVTQAINHTMWSIGPWLHSHLQSCVSEALAGVANTLYTAVQTGRDLGQAETEALEAATSHLTRSDYLASVRAKIVRSCTEAMASRLAELPLQQQDRIRTQIQLGARPRQGQADGQAPVHGVDGHDAGAADGDGGPLDDHGFPGLADTIHGAMVANNLRAELDRQVPAAAREALAAQTSRTLAALVAARQQPVEPDRAPYDGAKEDE